MDSDDTVMVRAATLKERKQDNAKLGHIWKHYTILIMDTSSFSFPLNAGIVAYYHVYLFSPLEFASSALFY